MVIAMDPVLQPAHAVETSTPLGRLGARGNFAIPAYLFRTRVGVPTPLHPAVLHYKYQSFNCSLVKEMPVLLP